MDYTKLVESAIQAKSKAYAKYSNFHVGAAILTQTNKIYIGANIENSVYGLTMCAERSAVYSALIDGEKKFSAIAIASDSKDFCPPCGSCRQVLMELCGPDIDVVLVHPDKKIKTIMLKNLLPHSFTKENLI